MTSEPARPSVGRLRERAGRRAALLLEYEPSWFAEFMSAIGILLWALFACLTNNYSMSRVALLMPVLGMALGPLRMILLFRVDALPRVLVACCGFVWWAWLVWSLAYGIGIAPAHGAFAALLVGDLLTVGKFSLAAYRQAREERMNAA